MSDSPDESVENSEDTTPSEHGFGFSWNKDFILHGEATFTVSNKPVSSSLSDTNPCSELSTDNVDIDTVVSTIKKSIVGVYVDNNTEYGIVDNKPTFDWATPVNATSLKPMDKLQYKKFIPADEYISSFASGSLVSSDTYDKTDDADAEVTTIQGLDVSKIKLPRLFDLKVYDTLTESTNYVKTKARKYKDYVLSVIGKRPTIEQDWDARTAVLSGPFENGSHMPVIELKTDTDTVLLPATLEHGAVLFFNKEITTEQYHRLLSTLKECGLVSEETLKSFDVDGYTSVSDDFLDIDSLQEHLDSFLDPELFVSILSDLRIMSRVVKKYESTMGKVVSDLGVSKENASHINDLKAGYNDIKSKLFNKDAQLTNVQAELFELKQLVNKLQNSSLNSDLTWS